MKVLVLVKNLYNYPGGAERSLMTLLKGFSNSFQIKGLYLGGTTKIFRQDDIEFYQVKGDVKRNYNIFTSILSLVKYCWKSYKVANKFRPDLIVTQTTFTPIAVTIAKMCNIKSVVFVRSFESICFQGFTKFPCNMKCFSCCNTMRSRLFYPLNKIHIIWLRWALKHSNLVISNSSFMQKILKDYLNLDSEVTYPFINFNDVLSNKKREKRFITFINPRKVKGIDIFVEVAKKMPERKFLVVGWSKPDDQIERLFVLPNVKYLGKVRNMRDIYSITRILLVPSIWPEPFGRVCVEAMANGIPCIASNVGGIKEAIGDCGIVIDKPFDIDLWVHAIKRFDNSDYYNDCITNIPRMLEKFNVQKNIKSFTSCLELTFPEIFC